MRHSVLRNLLKWYMGSALLLCFLAASVPGQVKVPELYELVPFKHRASLIRRLNLYFAYERSLEYGKVYSLLSKERSAYRSKYSRRQYIQYRQERYRKKRERFIKFSPYLVKRLNSYPQLYLIQCRAKIQYGEAKYVYENIVFIEAYGEHGEWYFGDVIESITD